VHPETLKDLARLADSNVLPDVPCQGSLGASGDLISMAHAVAPIFPSGSVRGPRDVIGLLNTNSMMAAYAIELFSQVKQMLANYESLLPDLLLATGASAQAFDERLFLSRQPHPNTTALLKLIKQRNSEKTSVHIAYGNRPVQNRYSMRVIPVLLDTFHKQVDFASELIVEEALAVADNPIISESDSGDIDVIHGGLFYTSSLAVALDTLNDVLCKLAELMDRQVLNLMDSSLSCQLPDNLFYQDQSHCKGIHQLTSALQQRVRTLGTSTKLMSFSCESNNQDVVPCSMTAANQLDDLLEVTNRIFSCFSFTTLRAKCIRLGADLPSELYVANWSKYDSSQFLKVQQQRANFGEL
jgi:histidine ammonia-lyase